MNLIPQVVRRGVLQLLGPLVQLLVRMHVRPNTITTVGTLLVIASALAFAARNKGGITTGKYGSNSGPIA